MEVTVVTVALIAYIAFRHWLRHDRRAMIHRERMAAIEKGVDLPALEQEVRRSGWDAQRMLLLAGLSWISIGIGAFVVLSVLRLAVPAAEALPSGIQWVGLPILGIGLAHLTVYWVGRKRER